MNKNFSSQDPRNIPTYSASDASRYLNIPASTIRSWVYGKYYRTRNEKRFSKPLIDLPISSIKQLSFTNLVEAHILRSIRTIHGISMDKVRSALDYLENELNCKHPLATVEFKTDGVDLFVESLGRLISCSHKGQQIIHKSLLNHLDRIESDKDNLAQKLFPFSGINVDRDLDVTQPKKVFIDPRISFGQLVLVNTGIPTQIIAERYKLGESIQDLAEDYNCDNLEIEEAIRWELPISA